MTALAPLNAVAGLVIIAAWILAITRVDLRWRRAHLRCCRCLHTWFGRAKRCGRCAASGQLYNWHEVHAARVSTHDWQGYLDTVEIPAVEPVR